MSFPERRTRRFHIWGRWIGSNPSYMVKEYDPNKKGWALVDTDIHANLKEIKTALCEMYPDYRFYRFGKIENDVRDYFGFPTDTPEAKRGFIN